jgi:hypothetical protein
MRSEKKGVKSVQAKSLLKLLIPWVSKKPGLSFGEWRLRRSPFNGWKKRRLFIREDALDHAAGTM